MANEPKQTPVRDFNRAVSFAAAIDANHVVSYSAAKTVNLPSSGDIPAGVTENDYASGADGEVITAGTMRCIAGGSIALDDLLVPDTSGHVVKAGASVPIIGRALTAQSTTGGFVEVEMMIGCYSPAGYA